MRINEKFGLIVKGAGIHRWLERRREESLKDWRTLPVDARLLYAPR